MVLDVRVPPETIIRCQKAFAEKGMKYFEVPGRKPTPREAGVEKMLAFLEKPPGLLSSLWEKIRVKYIGHQFSARQIRQIRELISENFSEPRIKFVRKICSEFGLYQANGKMKTAQVGQILVRIQMDNLIALPPVKTI